ncbi:uncharacterized protein LOC135845932 isoform X2 [Planococcus citri]|uniref:uncharacterized protein LOC135845932 isoform X2 n=1 Tax=Planococcus citri TaxID=170843 RepID=UPI0031F74122
MSEPSMVCNGHKENVDKCSVNAVSELYTAFEKSSANSTDIAENPGCKTDSMTIGTIPFPDFDHLYASSVEETAASNTMNLNIARSNLNSYHLNIIEEQAKIIDAQSQEICKLKKQNESLIARIERMNRRLSLNQCNRKSPSRVTNCSSQQNTSDSEPADNTETTNCSTESIKEEQLDDTFPDDVPLIKLASSTRKSSDNLGTPSISEENDGLEEPVLTQEEIDPIADEAPDSKILVLSKGGDSQSNFRIKFRRNNLSLSSEQRRKRSKMVRFAEENKNCLQSLEIKSPKRNCAKTVDDQLITDDAVLFLKSQSEPEGADKPTEETAEEGESGQTIKKKKSLKIPILVTSEPYYTTLREDICHDPVTYTPTSLEVPSFRTIDKDNIVEPPDVPKDYYEDVRIEAAKERHLRFEMGCTKNSRIETKRTFKRKITETEKSME